MSTKARANPSSPTIGAGSSAGAAAAPAKAGADAALAVPKPKNGLAEFMFDAALPPVAPSDAPNKFASATVLTAAPQILCCSKPALAAGVGMDSGCGELSSVRVGAVGGVAEVVARPAALQAAASASRRVKVPPTLTHPAGRCTGGSAGAFRNACMRADGRGGSELGPAESREKPGIC